MREHLPDGRLDWSARAGQELSTEERKLVSAYVRATETLDVDGLAALLREDLRFAMPPQPGVWVGRRETVQAWVDGGFGPASTPTGRCLTTTANGQPAVATYLRRPGTAALPTLRAGRAAHRRRLVAEIITFDS